MMSIQSTSNYIYILIISMVVVSSAPVFAQSADTTATDTTSGHKIKKPETAGRQLSIGIDMVRPFMNYLVSTHYGYEFEADWYAKNEFYLALEGGWGGSTVTYSNLSYNSSNDFIRFGFNKSLLPRDRPTDWDMMFFGLRLGLANVERGNANFTIADSLWGNVSGAEKGQSFLAYWAELTAGMRVEMARNFYAGWNLRGRFLLDGKSFNGLSPLYIAGYGRGDKNAVFDFNLYITYAIHWKRGPQKGIKPAGANTSSPPPAPGNNNR